MYLQIIYLINFIYYLSKASSLLSETPSISSINCQPIYVRWPRVKLNNQIDTASSSSSSIIENNLTFSECQKSCTLERDTLNKEKHFQCSAINYLASSNSRSNICQLFSSENVQHTDGYMEADDRYTFYWKFCVETSKHCSGEYAFTFFSDRYMLASEVNEIKFTHSLEECLAECLNSGETTKTLICRSVSFNRTDGGCHLSMQNQLSKPSSIRINNNPNYRIDYYENNCYNNSFTFSSNCEPNGIRISVDSLIPYTGALYGLYDFFSCRIEPKEQKHFELFFPYPNYAKNCSDSIRKTEDDYFLEVVLSTDGVEPLYFITADDLTYQARCPTSKKLKQQKNLQESYSSTTQFNIQNIDKTTTSITPITGTVIKSNYTRGNSINAILEELANSASIKEENHFLKHFENNNKNKKEKSELINSRSSSSTENEGKNEFTTTLSSTTITLNQNNEFKTTKDTFSLPLYSVLQNEFNNGKTEQTDSTSYLTTKSEANEASIIFIPIKLNNETNDIDNTTLSIQPNTTQNNQQTSTEIEFETTMVTLLTRNVPENNNLTKRRRPSTTGMEPFFEEDEAKNKQTETFSTSSSNSISTTTLTLPLQITSESLENSKNILETSPQTPQIKTTTKRSVNVYETINENNKIEQQSKEFSFSTHLSFTPDKIFLSTINNNSNIEKQINTTTATILIIPTTTTNLTQTTSIPLTTKISVNINEDKELIKNNNNTDKISSKMEAINEFNEKINKINEATKIESVTTGLSDRGNKIIKSEELINNNKSESSTISNTFTNITPESNNTESPLPPSTSSLIESSNLREKSSEAGSPPSSGDAHPPTSFGGNRPHGTEISSVEDRRSSQREKVIFEVFHNGQPADAVVVGSRITLAFTPYFAIPPSHMSISGCQVEPIGSLYDWEKEPLAIVKDGCQADHVGLVCPPQKTDYGIRVTVEAFRYQTTTQVQYTCLIRICPFAPCPQTTCPAVEGCPGDDIVSRTLGSFGGRRRSKRSTQNNEENINKNNQRRETVHWLAGSSRSLQQRDQPFRMSSALQQQLILLGGDSLVRRRLIVVNSDDELRYYTRTGEIPQIRPGFW